MLEITRRDALKFAVATGFAATLSRAVPAAWAADNPNAKPVRVGFIGVGDRGTSLLNVMLAFPGVEIPAVCDIDPKHLSHAQDIVEKHLKKRPDGVTGDPHAYRKLLAREDIDAVLIATPQELHSEMAIDAMNAGKAVGSEVPACVNIDECHALVSAQQKNKTMYMMLENYLYSQPVMMVQNMVNQGVFGDLTYGFGGYIHEIRSMRFNKDGSLTWRGENVLHTRGIVYPTHAIGPVCRWMGVNQNDKLVSLVCMDSKSAGNQVYAEKKFGKDSSQAKIQWENGDTNQCLVRTEQGRLIEVRYDTASPRPAGMGQYSLQGTKASYESAVGERKLYIEGKSKSEQWEDLEKYRPKYDHPYWAKRGEEAQKSGHGGGDYFVISDFLDAIRSGKSAVDVYDAVTWTSIRPLSEEAIRSGKQPVAIPDFKKDASA
ncbi:MAG TPA: Gfo/Idh/MocA family oxidoreductase [Tepidisphaeraceae bacterium]|jgi:predicted dehydrogenase|nr:Gfo/Idh/MocA family oxidoreductase [Tepidisphaeraceae bacterium]